MQNRHRNTAIVLGIAALVWGGVAAAQGHGQRGHDGPGGSGGAGFGEKIDFSELDADGDGNVSIAEMRAAENKRFSDMDTDGDGLVTGTELSAHALAKIETRMAQRFEQMLQWRDQNGDGALDAAEMSDGNAQMMFNRLDRNHDGMLSQEEVEQARTRGDRSQRGGGHGGGHGGG